MELSELTIDESIEAQPHQVFLPGCFVVLQGISGDGLANTVETGPDFAGQADGEGDDEDDDDDLMEEHEAGVEQQETCTSRETLPPLEEDHFRPNLTASTAASPTTIHQHLQSRVFATTGSSSVNPSLLVSQIMVASSQNPTCALNNPVVMNRGTIAVLPARPSAPPLQTVSEDQSEASPPPVTTPYPPDDSFVVVDSQQGGRNTASSSIHPANNASSTSTTRQERKEERRKQQAIRQWKQDLLQRQRLQRQEWQLQQQQHHPQHASSTVVQQTTDDWWLNPESGHLAVFDQLPSPTNQKKMVGTLPPGSPVTAYKLYTLDSETLQLIQVDEEHGNDDKPTIPPSIGVVQMLEIHWNNYNNTSLAQSSSQSQSQSSPSPSSDPNLITEQPTVAYCVYSVHGYAFLVPGHPSIYMNPQVWWWRVTCKVGAFLRQGLELSSDHRCTIPYGTFVQVTRKTVNRMGLSRLRVVARVDNKQVEGWCSEFLNPLSGQRGHVVQPLPFVVPALYRVTLPEGAVIRQDVELSSRQIGRAPYGTVLTIVQRQFSEHPQDQCVERLKLAGGDDTGWISVRLNQMPPEDCCVVELVGVDTRFQPDQPDEFHLQVFDEERIRILQQQDPSVPSPSVNPNSADDLSSVEEVGGSSSDAGRLHPNKARPVATNAVAAAAPGQAGSKRKQQVESCLICLTEQRNATIVHGETGHIACCLVCARILRARGDRCPVCRLEIDAVIQHFWA